jgi:hypothetical protein
MNLFVNYLTDSLVWEMYAQCFYVYSAVLDLKRLNNLKRHSDEIFGYNFIKVVHMY